MSIAGSARQSHVVGFAAGGGIAAIMPIASALLESDGSSRFTLFYGDRATASMSFAEQIQALKNRFLPRFAAHFFTSRETQDFEIYNGRIDAAKIMQLSPSLFDAKRIDQFYVCGPGSMAADVGAALARLGVEGRRIHTETLRTSGAGAWGHAVASEDAAVAGRAATTTNAAIAETVVSVRMDGRSRQFNMRRDGETSVLDAAAEAGIELPFSCKAGVCSTCRTHLTGGRVEMKQNYALEESELAQGFILACQSVPLTAAIELDYDER